MKFEQYLTEKKGGYEIYHSSFTSAIQESERYAESQGYTLDKEEWATDIGMGPAKPQPGKTNKYSLSLFKNDKKQRKYLNIQVYNRGNEIHKNFELNVYIA